MEFFTGLLRGGLGIIFCLGVCFLLSNNRKAINWKLVGWGMGLQVILAILILKVPFIENIFQTVANFFVVVLQFTDKGAEFLFAGLVTDMDTFGYIFAFKVLPTVVFFSALSSLLYYLGILQIIIKGFAWVMSKTM
ncbi:MAG: CNT family concentrative nucleoside transporter, partial [Granulosicoccus sp.]